MMYVMCIVYIFIGSQTTLCNYYNIISLTPYTIAVEKYGSIFYNPNLTIVTLIKI